MKAHLVVNYSETKVHEINSRSQKIFSKYKLLYYAENGLQQQTHLPFFDKGFIGI